MAITGTFIAGKLNVFGDSLDNTITESRDAAGTILINGGAIAIQGGKPTVANTTLSSIFGQAGNDTITLNESNGALPAAQIFGGDGNDVITGGSGGDMLFGQAGNDTLLGKGGNDLLFGGDGNDTLTGGGGDDTVLGEAGDDRMVWNPGDDTDREEGGAGVDTVQVNGGNAGENFGLATNGTRLLLSRDVGGVTMDVAGVEQVNVNALGGADNVTVHNLAGTGVTAVNLDLSGAEGSGAGDGAADTDTVEGTAGNDAVQVAGG